MLNLKNNRKIIFFLLFLFCSFVYLFFLAAKIRKIAEKPGREESVCDLHVLVAGTDCELEPLKAFYEGINSIPEPAVVFELLEAEGVKNFIPLNEIYDYTELVCADGLIVFSGAWQNPVRMIKDFHGRKIPLVFCGSCLTGGEDSSEIFSVLPDYKVLSEEVIKEIKKTGITDIILVSNESDNALAFEQIFPELKDSLRKGFNLSVLKNSSSNSGGDEISDMLSKNGRSGKKYILLCFDSSAVNMIARTVVEMNLTDSFCIMSFSGNDETSEFIEKGIVHFVVMPDFYSYGRSCAEQILSSIKNKGGCE